MPEPASQDAATAQLMAGFVVGGKYELIEPLGSGSMGSVWAARHLVLGHKLAVKFLRDSLQAVVNGPARFEREAKLSARLGQQSSHIALVIDYGVLDSGIPFVVMELLRGEDLEARITREGPLSRELVVTIVGQLCKALSVAHAAGVVHRDLKPANVFLCPAEGDEEGIHVKLLDFGVAKGTLDADDTQTTRAGTILGTPGYMSPEQISGELELDRRLDLWALGVLAYRMATGKMPFGKGKLSELAMRILSVEPLAPSSARPGLPAAFDPWMKKALSKNPEERFQTAEELAQALTVALDGEPNPSAVPSGLAAGLDGPPGAPGRRGLFVALAAVVALLVAATFWIARSKARVTTVARTPEPPTATAAKQAAPAPLQTAAASASVAPPVPPPEASASAPKKPATVKVRPAASRRRPSRRPADIQKKASRLWHKMDEL